MQQDLSALGINVTINQMDWNVFVEERKAGNFDFCREGWLADFNDPINMLASTYGKKMMKLIPFIVGILAGYVAASIFAFIGRATGSAALIVIDYSAFSTMKGLISAPGFTFLMGSGDGITGTYILTLFAAYVPVAFVVFAEHLADHKNLSSIVGVDLLEKPGLTRTLLGDGIGSMPAPSSSIQPSPLQVGQPLPPHLWHWISSSQLGSVKGKWWGRNRVTVPSP